MPSYAVFHIKLFRLTYRIVRFIQPDYPAYLILLFLFFYSCPVILSSFSYRIIRFIQSNYRSYPYQLSTSSYQIIPFIPSGYCFIQLNYSAYFTQISLVFIPLIQCNILLFLSVYSFYSRQLPRIPYLINAFILPNYPAYPTQLFCLSYPIIPLILPIYPAYPIKLCLLS